jgi:hypothetical protein
MRARASFSLLWMSLKSLSLVVSPLLRVIRGCRRIAGVITVLRRTWLDVHELRRPGLDAIPPHSNGTRRQLSKDKLGGSFYGPLYRASWAVFFLHSLI